MLPLLRFSVRHPWTVALVALALCATAGAFVPGVALRLDGRSLIPEGHEAMRSSDEAATRFGLRDTVVLGIVTADGIYDPGDLGALTDLSAELAEVPGIAAGSVLSLATVPRLAVEAGVWDLRPLLSRDGGASARDPAVAARVRTEVEALGLDDGILVARDGAAAGVFAEVALDADRYRLREDIRTLAARFAGPGREVWWSGSALVQAALGEAAALDLVRLVPLVLLIVGGVLTVAYRHPAPALISLAEVGVSLVWTVGALGALGQGVYVTTLALPVILVVIGVSDDVYALNRVFRQARDEPERALAEVVTESFAAIHRPVLMTSATTVVGLLSLAAASVEPQRVFGVFGALSVVFSTLMTFTLVPALLVAFKVRVPPRQAPTHRVGERAVRFLLAALGRFGPRRTLAAVAALSAVAGLLSTQLAIDDTWVRNLDPDSDLVRGDRKLNERLSGTNTLELLFDSGEPAGIVEPRRFANLGVVEAALAAHPAVGAVVSPFSEVVRLSAALEGEPYAEFRHAVVSGQGSLSETRIEQALLLLGSLGRSPLADRVDPDRQRCRMTVFVRGADYAKIGEVLAAARDAAAPEFPAKAVVPFGDGWIGHKTVELLVVGQVTSIAIALGSDLLLLLATFASFVFALVAIAPVILSVLAVFGVIAATGTPLGTATSMFAAIALGIGVDYSIHLVSTFRQAVKSGLSRDAALESALTLSGPAILTSAVAISAGFLVLGGSEVLPNRQLGLLVALTMTVCAVMTLVLVPALVLFRRERPS